MHERLDRRTILAFAGMTAASAMSSRAEAQVQEIAAPAQAGWSADKLQDARAFSESLNPTAVMILQSGKIIAHWGDITRKVNAASVRKSLLGALYGIAVAEGRINLASTLGELGIDDKPPSLSETEKQATVADLLKARSGIYHRAAHETADMRATRPQRHSHAPGSFWFYNNWDFNALGTIYRQLTSEDIFRSFQQRIATPIGMEDFTVEDGRYVLEKNSDHPAYTFKLSARDAARFGQLYLNGGQWNGQQIVPAAWVKDSTTSYSVTGRGSLGYGYLWWTLRPDKFGPGAALASGFGGQVIALVPARNLVVVQRVDLKLNPQGIKTRDFLRFLHRVMAAAP